MSSIQVCGKSDTNKIDATSIRNSTLQPSCMAPNQKLQCLIVSKHMFPTIRWTFVMGGVAEDHY